ncbi:MAG TPA: hypothetical protein VGN18_08200 [Jatrophihabitans sp.]|uniref:hypothetical protein n=1 Tax=Jatrophihabitans sp. TaxID=1932789 RepID=UPI002E07F0D5|nr:hypothetical protein [Jatrophihabitans sp.]
MTPPDDERPPGALEWAGVVLLCLCAVLAAVLEALLVPLYAGSVVVPIAVVAALVTNVAFPRMARVLVPSTIAAALPLVAWLVVIVVFGVVTRPEGDVILPGGSGAVHWVSYGVMLGGALAGTITVVVSTPPPAPRGPVNR